MKSLIDELADDHVAQSIAGMREQASRVRWTDGTRAKEQAAAIVARIIAEAQRRLEERIFTNES